MESENQMLKHQVLELRRSNISNQNNHEELEQYGRRLCLRIDGVLTKTEAKVDIPEPVIGRTHRTGSRYLVTFSDNYCKSIITRFTTFRRRTMSYRAKNKLK